MKSAQDVKPLMARLMGALSAEEREEVCTGRWVGLTAPVNESAAVAAKRDAEKAKVLKDILASANK